MNSRLMKGARMRSIAGGLVFLAGFAACAMASDTLTLLKPGVEAPAFSLPTLDGKREALRIWCGDSLLKPYSNSVKHVVIVNFWATYCKPCQKEIPQLSAFMKKHAADPVKLFCISIDKEGADKVRPFVQDKGYDVPVLLDPYARTAQRYGVKSVPALFVIAPGGKIHYAASGYDEDSDILGKLEKVYAEVKAGKSSSSNKAEVAGEQVAVKNSATATAPPEVSPRDRWKAVARVECGENPVDVAKGLGVEAAEVKAWYNELKESALNLWASEHGKQ